jgi:Domain of unknown function (DUF4349)
MLSTFKNRFKKVSFRLAGIFVILFLFRLLYGYLELSGNDNRGSDGDFFSQVENVRKNYASEKLAFHNNVQQQATVAQNQKYEKTATVKTKTAQFEKDEAAVRQTIRSFHGVTQYEQNAGNKGSRVLHLLIGIVPDSFDVFYEAIQKTGSIRSKEITKTDKTNEYRKLNARKASLEKTLISLSELKSRGGAITDYVSLHDKILEIESQLQELGVELGNFDAENEFCTVKLSLYEGASDKIGFPHRLKVAFEWTVKWYALLMIAFTELLLATFLLLLITDRLNILAKFNGR